MRGITGDANFVQAIYENGITYDAIAQVWGRAKRNCEKMFSAHLLRKKPTPPASHAPGVAELSLSTGIAVHRDSEHRIYAPKGTKSIPRGYP